MTRHGRLMPVMLCDRQDHVAIVAMATRHLVISRPLLCIPWETELVLRQKI